MKLLYNNSCIPYFILNNFLTKQEEKLVFDEIFNFLPKLKTAEKTESAGIIENDKITYTKKNKGIFLDSFYNTNRNKSMILNSYQKIFEMKLMKKIASSHWYYDSFLETNSDSTLLQSYGNGDYYKSHRDYSTFTLIGLHYKLPKAYSGGDLCFTDYNHSIELNNNQAILFPSIVRHEVKPVIKNNDDEQGNRFTITKFISYMDHRHIEILKNKGK